MSDTGGRSRRDGASKGGGTSSKAKGALARLAELRRSGAKAINSFEVDEEADKVYDLLDDDQYADLVEKRRQEGGACWRWVMGGVDRGLRGAAGVWTRCGCFES